MLETTSGIKVSGANDSWVYSFRANIATKDKSALLEENKTTIQSAIKTAPDESNTTSNLGKNYVKIAFEDGQSGQLVVLNLSFGNALNLIKNFSTDDFFTRSDGILRLNGKAQNFVAGWFEKVAYEMNLLSADTDKNGLVKGKELSDTFVYQSPFLLGNSNNPDDISEVEFYGGRKLAFDESCAGFFYDEDTIESLLNYFVSLDKNADNKITFTEFFGSLNALLGKAETGISSADCGGNAKINLLQFVLEQLEKLQEGLQESLKESGGELKEKAIQKGLWVLSGAELELFKSQNPLDYERLKNEQENAENLDNSPPNLPENSTLAKQNQNANTLTNPNSKNSNSAFRSNENSQIPLNLADENANFHSLIQESGENLHPFSQTNDKNSLSNALLTLEKAMSADLLAQIKEQGVGIIDLKA